MVRMGLAPAPAGPDCLQRLALVGAGQVVRSAKRLLLERGVVDKCH
jgi:hypothetical protein